jgi:hypothetical protein
MGWGKIVLIFQAAITLVIGIFFFIGFMTTPQINVDSDGVKTNAGDFSERFEGGSYILAIISLIELVIISRFV